MISSSTSRLCPLITSSMKRRRATGRVVVATDMGNLLLSCGGRYVGRGSLATGNHTRSIRRGGHGRIVRTRHFRGSGATDRAARGGTSALLHRVGEQVVLHGEEGGGGAGGDADLVVDVLDVVPDRDLRDRERARHLLVGQAARQQAQHRDLAFAQAGGMAAPG